MQIYTLSTCEVDNMTNNNHGNGINSNYLSNNNAMSVSSNSSSLTTQQQFEKENLDKQDNENYMALCKEQAISDLIKRTEYACVQENGQRRYGPPPNLKVDIPPRGSEVYIAKIPKDCFEDELIPVFEKIGPIYMFRLMLDFNGTNRGYGFCLYTNREHAKQAIQKLNNYEIRKSITLGVCMSVDNCKLFIGGIPKNKTREEILVEIQRITEGVRDVISYPSINDKTKNRGFAFVEYVSHKAAAMARRKLHPGHIQLFGHQIAVDWADPEPEVNEDIMSKVKVLYVRNLMVSTTEETLREACIKILNGDTQFVERVKKITDYAFIHFKEREQAAECLMMLNDTYLDGSKIEVTWAKPVDRNELSNKQQSLAARSNNKIINDYIQNEFNLGIIPDSAFTAPTGLLPQGDSMFSYYFPSIGTVPTSSSSLPLPVINTNNQNGPLSSEMFTIGMNRLPITNNELNFSNSKLNVTRPGRRNAAGSRSVWAQRDRKHPIEKLQQRQFNPMASVKILSELSKQSGLGDLIYKELPVDLVNSINGTKLKCYVGQIFFTNSLFQFQTPQCYATPAEARLRASELALQCIAYNLLGSNEDKENVNVHLSLSNLSINSNNQQTVNVSTSTNQNTNTSNVVEYETPQLPLHVPSINHISYSNITNHMNNMDKSHGTNNVLYNNQGSLLPFHSVDINPINPYVCQNYINNQTKKHDFSINISTCPIVNNPCSGLASNFALTMNPNVIGNVSSVIPMSLGLGTSSNLVDLPSQNLLSINSTVPTNSLSLVNSNPTLSSDCYAPAMLPVSGFDFANSQLVGTNPNLYGTFNNANYYYDPGCVAAAIATGSCLPQSNTSNQAVIVNSNNLSHILGSNELTNQLLTGLYTNIGSHNIPTISPTAGAQTTAVPHPPICNSQTSVINLLNQNGSANSILNCSIPTNTAMVTPNAVFQTQ